MKDRRGRGKNTVDIKINGFVCTHTRCGFPAYGLFAIDVHQGIDTGCLNCCAADGMPPRTARFYNTADWGRIAVQNYIPVDKSKTLGDGHRWAGQFGAGEGVAWEWQCEPSPDKDCESEQFYG